MFQRFSDLPAFRRDPLALLQSRGRSGPPLPRLELGLKPIYLCADPALVRDILRADEADIDKGRHVGKLRAILGANSLTMSGDGQRKRRASIHQTFAQGMKGDYVAGLSAVVRSWIADLARETEIDAHQATAHLTLRVTCAVLFGHGALTSGDEALLIQAVRLVEDDLAADMFRGLPLMPWTSAARRRKLRQAREMMSLVVERTCRRATSVSLLRALEGLGLTREELRDEVLVILLAAHHPTGASAAWQLHAIATDPGLARQLAEEAMRVCDPAGEVTPLALRSASSSRALSQEILRLYPSTYWMSRDLKRDQEVAGLRLTRGTTLLISQWHLHRDPRYWPEPERLRLDRSWSANPAYMPFGFGSRACTGMSVALLMLQLISLEFALCFDAELAPGAVVGSPKPSVTLVPPTIRLRIGVRGGTAAKGRAAA